MSSNDDENEEDYVNIFEEPEGFYKPEAQPTSASYQTLQGIDLNLRLVGNSPLWGHLLWNAGRTLAEYLEQHAASLIRDRTILELGAGAGLPSLICALNGAKQVVVTDYPDADLISNLRHNIDVHAHLLPSPNNIAAEGYLWGSSVEGLTSHLTPTERASGFDLLILGDLLFNHSEHPALLSTIQQTLKKSADSRALVFSTPYRPWLLQKDLAFFDLARQEGFIVVKILEKVMDDVMFANDPGDETLRKTVFGYSLRWNQHSDS